MVGRGGAAEGRSRRRSGLRYGPENPHEVQGQDVAYGDSVYSDIGGIDPEVEGDVAAILHPNRDDGDGLEQSEGVDVGCAELELGEGLFGGVYLFPYQDGVFGGLYRPDDHRGAYTSLNLHGVDDSHRGENTGADAQCPAP